MDFLRKTSSCETRTNQRSKKKKEKKQVKLEQEKKKKFQWRENKVKGGLALQEMKYWSFDQVEEEGSLFWLGCSKQ